MSDLRHDPINDQWVTVAKNRRERPMEFVSIEQTRKQIICPFCKGNEEETPSALAAYQADGTQLESGDDQSNWTVRVVPNLYPSFSQWSSEKNGKPAAQNGGYGPYQLIRPNGIQEIVIPSSRHVISMSELTDNELTLSFQAYQDRMKHVNSLDYVKHAMLFMNCRAAAGASLGHVHTQLIGSPVVSSHLRSRVQRNQAHFREHGSSLMESLIQWEMASESRIVEVTDNFCIVCPFASRFAFQVWIVPLKRNFDFLTCSPDIRNELAMHCRSQVSRMESLLDNPGYNLLLHTDPFGMSEIGSGYVELFPRLTRAAGFEWGTDIWINPVAPEAAARGLRVSEEVID
jgi:UDPglucose--hexose-1-phosphate uridylyltransferase